MYNLKNFVLAIHFCLLHNHTCPYRQGDRHTNGMYIMLIDMVQDYTLLRDSRVRPKSHYPPKGTQDDVPEALVALVAKFNILIDTTGVKGDTLFPRYQSR